MKTVNFRTAIKLAGYTIKKWSNGYNFRSAFAEKDGQLYYFHIGDLRDKNPFMYYRTVEDLNDYHGGANLSFASVCEELGIEVFEPHKKCDFNSL